MAIRKTLIDYIATEDYDTYTALLDKAEANKAAAKAAKKSERKPRGPMTNEQKAKLAQGKIAKLQAQLEALLAATGDDAE